jgi:hypothetical protein
MAWSPKAYVLKLGPWCAVVEVVEPLRGGVE